MLALALVWLKHVWRWYVSFLLCFFSIELAIPYSSTGFFQKISESSFFFSKAAPVYVQWLNSSIFFFEETRKNAVNSFFPSSTSFKFGFLFEEWKTFSKESFLVCAVFFNATVHPNLLQSSMTTKIYLKPSSISDHSRLSLITPYSRCTLCNLYQFC